MRPCVCTAMNKLILFSFRFVSFQSTLFKFCQMVKCWIANFLPHYPFWFYACVSFSSSRRFHVSFFCQRIPQSEYYTQYSLITAFKINIHLYFAESSVIFCAHASCRWTICYVFWSCNVYSLSHIHQNWLHSQRLYGT